MSFYTEQLLTVCLGLTLALAFVVETQREYRRIDLAGAIAVATILAYIAYRFPNPLDVPPLLWAGLALALIWTLLASRPAFARWFDFASAAVSLLLCGYIFVRYEPLTYELAMLPVEGIVGSAILIFLVLDEPPHLGLRLRRHHPGDGGLHLHQPAPAGDFQTRWVSPERLAYLGLDVNSMIGSILRLPCWW